MEKLKIWYAASEVAPFAKTGGLADVAGSLPKALAELGVDIRVVMPKYGLIDSKYVDMMEYVGYTYIDLTWRHEYCGIFKIEQDGVTYYFLDNEKYFYRDWYYGNYDDGERFSFFCKAIFEILPVIDFKPQVIHSNDWQTGLVSVLLDAHYRHYRKNGFYKNIHTVFTIHNLQYQGIFPKEIMDSLIGLSWDYFYQDGVEFYDNINFLKAGLAFSTKITTVSPTYAEEIKYEYFGENLAGFIRKRSNDLIGILNGIDYDVFNPATDKRIYQNYDKDDLKTKYENKKQLQKEMNLPIKESIPVIGIISRLVEQKGFDLIDRMIGEILNLDLQIVLLGTGDKHYEDMFKWAQSVYPEKISVNITYDVNLAQKIYAGTDMFLMPSRFEPCGLSQMISMRYGTVPIVRETGGLKDTVIPFNPVTNEGTGFSFTNYNAHEMKNTIVYAVETFKKKKTWEKIIKRCMAQDFSWRSSASKYKKLYENICFS